MKRRKRPLLLMLGVCVALVVAGFIRKPNTETKSGPQTKDAHYMVVHRIRPAPSNVVNFDRSIQFTFSGDPTISPGSLGEMTSYMHRSEIEIATQLARDIKFPTPP